MAITEVKVLLTNYIIVLVAGIALAISVQVSWWYLFPFTVIEAFLVRYYLGIKCPQCGLPVHKAIEPYYFWVPVSCIQCQRPYD